MGLCTLKIINVYFPTSLAANCGDPLDEVSDHGSLLFLRDANPSLEGSTVNFTCPPGLVLIGPNLATCMENGEWEPDPREVRCTGK